MELVKKNIHMNKLKCRSNVQLTLDDDFNVPDVKPDIEKIIREQGTIRIDEIKAMNGKLMVKGFLDFNILYISSGDQRPVHNITGEIPFDEIVNMDEACQDDNINVKWELEDLNTSLINSRKISVKAIVSFLFAVEEMYEEETAIMVEGDDSVQYRNKKMGITQVAVNKKDTYRIKDEIVLPSNRPNIYEILYSDLKLSNLDMRLLDGNINIKGELELFVLYSGEEDNGAIQYFENEVPFGGNIECSGCNEEMISDIRVCIQSKDLEIKPDSDGEERIIDLEAVLGLDIKIYEDQELEVLSDVYSTSQEIRPIRKEAGYENLLIKNNNKSRVSDRIKIKENEPGILQICSSTGEIKIDEMEAVEDGINVDGVIEVQILYITNDDERPINSIKGIVPFNQLVEVKEINKNCLYDIKPGVEQISVIMLDSNEIEVKVNIELNTIVFRQSTEMIITGLESEALDLEKIQEMPSIIGYAVKPFDSLWEIAKKYYTTVESIKEINSLEKEDVTPGDKLLIIKEINPV